MILAFVKYYYYLLLFFPHKPCKVVKAISGWQGVQSQAMGQIWPLD